MTTSRPEDLAPEALWHLSTPADWEVARHAALIEPASLADEGFVHCSWGRQVAGTVSRHFGEVTELLALRLDPEALGTPVVEEDSYGSGQAYPHLYAPVPTDAVVEVVTLRRG